MAGALQHPGDCSGLSPVYWLELLSVSFVWLGIAGYVDCSTPQHWCAYAALTAATAVFVLWELSLNVLFYRAAIGVVTMICFIGLRCGCYPTH